MISYVLVMMMSLATGQITHAYVEGPMSDSWCEQLIVRDSYRGNDGTSLKVPSCMSWPDAQRTLLQNLCMRMPQPNMRGRHQFACVAPPPVPERVAAPIAATIPVATAAPLPAPVTAAVRGPSARRAATQIAPPVAAPATRSVSRPVASTQPALRSPKSIPPHPTAAPTLPTHASSTAPQGRRSDAGTSELKPELPTPSQQSEASGEAAQTAPPQRPVRGMQKQFTLGPAPAALLAQAHTQAAGGQYGPAAETVERALRIEPDNPLLWVELGQLRLRDGDAAEADGIGRKALALAAGDSQVQVTAWRLIAESLRARGRNPEAAEADRSAAALVPQ
jgi:hypothetical protein